MILGNQLDDRANRGVSDFDRTHRFVLSYVWDIPFPARAASSTARYWLLGDWQASSVIVAMSGPPIDVVDTMAGSFYGLDKGSSPLARPNFSPGANCITAAENVPVTLFFNPFAFTRPVVQPQQPIPSSGKGAVASAIGTDIGTAGRNCLRGWLQQFIGTPSPRRLTVSTLLIGEWLSNHSNKVLAAVTISTPIYRVT